MKGIVHTMAATTDKEIARKDAKEAAELFKAACYQVLVNLDVLKEMELIQEILDQIRSVREWLIILDMPIPAPVYAPAAETMTIPAFAIPPIRVPWVTFDSAGHPHIESKVQSNG